MIDDRRMAWWLTAILGGIMLTGCAEPPVAAPTSYASYESHDNTQTFKCDYPEGWEVEGGGKTNAWAKFSSGSALIEVRTDLSGSLLGDIARAAVDEENADTDPVAQVHAGDLASAQAKFSGYAEPGAAEKLECSLGPARRSEFTASGSFGASVHGYRMTILAHDRRVVAYCSCSESDWNTLKPAFDHVAESFTRP
ncbi:MAG: hypothetical protein KDA60_20660 [Planctomycetales bacterium]|nr:hypothetical protein [Planctomycetales bacterium]